MAKHTHIYAPLFYIWQAPYDYLYDTQIAPRAKPVLQCTTILPINRTLI